MFVLVLDLNLLWDCVYLIAWVRVYSGLREKDIFMSLCTSVCESEMFVFVLEPNPAFINTDYYPGGITVFPLWQSELLMLM